MICGTAVRPAVARHNCKDQTFAYQALESIVLSIVNRANNNRANWVHELGLIWHCTWCQCTRSLGYLGYVPTYLLSVYYLVYRQCIYIEAIGRQEKRISGSESASLRWHGLRESEWMEELIPERWQSAPIGRTQAYRWQWIVVRNPIDEWMSEESESQSNWRHRRLIINVHMFETI